VFWGHAAVGSHKICALCLRRYIEAYIVDGENYYQRASLRCPCGGCSYRLSYADVESTFAGTAECDEVLEKFLRISVVAHANRRRNGSRLKNLLLHKAWWDQLSVLYRIGQRPRDRTSVLGLASEESSEVWVSKTCQACPECLVLIERDGGCPHMSCPCGGEFCLMCGTPYDIVRSESCCSCEGGHPQYDAKPILAHWMRNDPLARNAAFLPEEADLIQQERMLRWLECSGGGLEADFFPERQGWRDDWMLGIGFGEPEPQHYIDLADVWDWCRPRLRATRAGVKPRPSHARSVQAHRTGSKMVAPLGKVPKPAKFAQNRNWLIEKRQGKAAPSRPWSRTRKADEQREAEWQGGQFLV